jgi:superfamily II helicase
MVKKIIADLLEETQKEKQESKEKRKARNKELVKKKLRKRKCKWCREWFIPKRIGQIYCSDTCADNKHNDDLKKDYHEKKETPTPCSHCNKKVPLFTLSKNNLCETCESKKKVCPYCKNTFIHKNDKRVFCSLRCSALNNQKKMTEARKGISYDLQEILDDLIPYLKYDCTLPEACAQTGRSYSTVKHYLY